MALVTPVFHNLHEAISDGLMQLGLRVTTIVYDGRFGPSAKVRGKITIDVPEHLGFNLTERVRKSTTDLVSSKLRELNYDILLVVKGDSIDSQLIADQRARGKRTVLWLYDAIVNTSHSIDSLAGFDTVASFSPSDVNTLIEAEMEAKFVPLAADLRFSRQAPLQPTGPDIVFFGARYHQRETWLTQLSEMGYSVKAYGRDWSRSLKDRIRSLSWHRPAFATATDIPRKQVADVSCQAIGVLNMHNRDQDGFNLRTFEVPGACGLQLIDRDDVEQFYEPGLEVLVYHNLDEATAAIDRARNDRPWANAVRKAARKRTLKRHTFAHRVEALLG